MTHTRRRFLQQSTGIVLGGGLLSHTSEAASTMSTSARDARRNGNDDNQPFHISLAEWSLHRTIGAGEMTNLDFPTVARQKFNIEAIEYVNSFFKDKARDHEYLRDLKQRCDAEGVKSLLIMCDGEGALGDADEAKRTTAIENHYRWVEAAKYLGCHSIRVNAQSSGTPDEQQKLAADGLRRLTEFSAQHDINTIVENHGGLSSNGSWLAGVMKMVDHDRCGTLPDFGNFCMDWSRRDDPEVWYDRYKGVQELMPFAKAVSAKSNDFDDETGEETTTDYARMINIVLESGYTGWIGIEYEGSRLDEAAGIIATKKLLERVRADRAKSG
ncbi:MAG: sugar phosphate isomerase/epimerase family protein [Phycisphaerales bacterium]